MARPTILERVSFTAKHIFCHIFLYFIPRTISFLLYKLPRFVVGFFKSKNKKAYLQTDNLFRKEREIVVLANEADHTALHLFGLDDDEATQKKKNAEQRKNHNKNKNHITYFNTHHYEFPLYNGHVQTILGGLRPNAAATDDPASSRGHDRQQPKNKSANAAHPKKTDEQEKQTVYDYSKVYKRETVVSYDGQPLNLDFLFPPHFHFFDKKSQDAKEVMPHGDDAPVNTHVRGILFIIPGLLNSSTSNYLFHFAKVATQTENYVVCSLNWRGMGSKPLEVPRLFSATNTDDIRHVLHHYFFSSPSAVSVHDPLHHYYNVGLLQHFGLAVPASAPVVAVGFSLGGINLIKYVAEQEVRAQEALQKDWSQHQHDHNEADKKAWVEKNRHLYRNTPLAAVLCMTSPFDLNGSDVCAGSWQYTQIYEKAFALGLRKYAKHNKEMLLQLPNVDTRYLSFEDDRKTKAPENKRKEEGAPTSPENKRKKIGIHQIKSIREFDTYINASHNGFRTTDEYYAAANSLPWLERMGAAAAAAIHADKNGNQPQQAGDQVFINNTYVCCISNSDDPLCGPPVPHAQWRRAIARNKNAVYVETPAGGHLGYLGSVGAEWRGAAGPSDLLLLHLADSFCVRHAQAHK